MSLKHNHIVSILDKEMGLALDTDLQSTLDAKYVNVAGDTMTGTLTIDTANEDGLVFGSLGTADRAIDLSNCGLSGSDDYPIYIGSSDWWDAAGNLKVGNYVTTNYGVEHQTEMGSGHLYTSRTDGLHLQYAHSAGIRCFSSIAIGNNPELRIYGYTTGAAASNYGTITTSGTNVDLTITSQSGGINFDNENLLTTGTLGAGAATVTTLDTGQGANELYDMNQNVQTTDTPQFARLGLGTAAHATNKLQLPASSIIGSVGAMNIDLVNASDVTLTLQNTGAGVLNIISDGKLQLNSGATETSNLTNSVLLSGVSLSSYDFTWGTSGTVNTYSTIAGNTGYANIYWRSNYTGTTAGYSHELFNFDIDHSGVLADGPGTNDNVYGIRGNANFTGTVNDADANIYVYGAKLLGTYTGATLTSAATVETYGGHFTGTGITGVDTAYGIYAAASGATTNYAGYFSGDIGITGGSIVLVTNGETLTIPYDASRNVIYGSGAAILMPAGLTDIIGIQLVNPATGTQLVWPFAASGTGSSLTGIAFDYTNTRSFFARAGTPYISFYLTTAGGMTLHTGQITIATAKTPASATDTGTTGTICWDSSFLYMCVATNSWERVAIAPW